MYQVYCDRFLLHDVRVEGLKLISPKLDLELNKTGSFTFTIYPQHPYFSRIKKMESIITVKHGDEIIFRGRPLNDVRGFKNERQVTCEGELAFLIDTVQRPYSFSGDIPELFRQFIDAHNLQVDESKRFKVGKITVTDPNGYIARSDTQYLTTYDSIFKKLIDTHGGYLNFRHESDGVYIDYLEDFDIINGQDIVIRKNILDLKDTAKGENIYTALIPLGAKITEENETTSEKRLTIKSVNGGKDYIYDEEAVNRFGWIFSVKTWDDVTIPGNLLRKGKETLANSFLFDRSLEISAVDLAGTGKQIDSFRIGMYNNVYSDVHDLKERLLVTKQTLNLTNPAADKLTLGKTFKSFIDQGGGDTDIGDIIDRVEDIIGDYEINKPVIDEMINRLTLELNQNHPNVQRYTGGIFVPDYHSDPLVITPEVKYKNKPATCTFIWKNITDGTEKDVSLENGESVSENGVLTVNKNIAGSFLLYKCYATLKTDSVSLVANQKTEITRLNDGEEGPPGVPGEQGPPGEDGTVISKTEPNDKDKLWCDTSVDPPVLRQWNGKEWVIVGDYSEYIENLRQELKSAIKQESDALRFEVSENYYLKGETEELLSSQSTKLEQTKDHFDFLFNTFNKDLSDLGNSTGQKFEQISKYIRFIDGKIVLGEAGNELMLEIRNDRISFLQNNAEVAYFSNRKLYVTDGEYTNSLTLGNFSFIPRKNGNLSFVKVR